MNEISSDKRENYIKWIPFVKKYNSILWYYGCGGGRRYKDMGDGTQCVE